MNLNCVASQYASFKFIAACFCCSVFPCGSKITSIVPKNVHDFGDFNYLPLSSSRS